MILCFGNVIRIFIFFFLIVCGLILIFSILLRCFLSGNGGRRLVSVRRYLRGGEVERVCGYKIEERGFEGL